jgi:hypothetical protein
MEFPEHSLLLRNMGEGSAMSVAGGCSQTKQIAERHFPVVRSAPISLATLEIARATHRSRPRPQPPHTLRTLPPRGG